MQVNNRDHAETSDERWIMDSLDAFLKLPLTEHIKPLKVTPMNTENNIKQVFICGPLRAETPKKRLKNIQRAEAEARRWVLFGFPVHCPHSKGRYIDDDEVRAESILEAEITWLRASDIVVVLPGWKKSEGSRGEMGIATHRNMTTVYKNKNGSYTFVGHAMSQTFTSLKQLIVWLTK